LIGHTSSKLLAIVFNPIFESQVLTDDTCSGIDVAPQSGFSVTGGGHSAAVVQKLGMDSRLDHVSTGGGACIDFLAGEKLPGIEALKEASVRYMGK